MSKQVLVVDDEPDILELVRFALTQEGFSVATAKTGQEALDYLKGSRPDAMVLDLMLPDFSGTEVCRRIRANADTATLPIIMLTARSEELDRVVGFELGADDYVTKPFSARELSLRVKAVLRRSGGPKAETRRLVHGSLVVDLERHRCSIDDRTIELTAKEFGLLATLMSRPGRVMSREKLLDEVWGEDIAVTHRTIDTHLKRLREKLGDAGNLIDTVRGVGYRFSD